MKKLLIIFLAILMVIPVGAVLKERDLARTLGVLRAELEMTVKQQEAMMSRYSQMQTSQHSQLVDYMQRSEQIALMLYSQRQDFTFDLAYACQQATDLYQELSNKTVPYARIQQRLETEISRYDGLIKSLQELPPRVEMDEDGNIWHHGQKRPKIRPKDLPKSLTTKTEHDDHHHKHRRLDSVDIASAAKVDSIADSLGVADTTAAAVADSVMHLSDAYSLTKSQQADRDTCLAIAYKVRENLKSTLETINADNLYYTTVSANVEKLNNYALDRYKALQQNIFVNGGDNYFQTLLKLPRMIRQARNDVNTKYASFDRKGHSFSEWRGPVVNFIILFIILWITIATILSNVILRTLPNRFLPSDFREKRRLYFIVLGMFIFAVSVMILRNFITQNFVLMATELIISMAWLAFAIFLSLLIRVNGTQLKGCVKTYMPFILMAFIVIMFRILFIPNNLVNLIYPPVLLGFCIWQVRSMRAPKGTIPSSDLIYGGISMLAMVIATILAWTGYVLFAVEIMVWWMFQLAAIQTITCIYHLLERYERRFLFKKVKIQKYNDEKRKAELLAQREALQAEEEEGEEVKDGENLNVDVEGNSRPTVHKKTDDKELLKKARNGEYINLTFLFDFITRALVPIMAIASAMMSVWYAAKIFEMTEALKEVFYFNFVDQKNILQLSLHKIVIVACCWFVFRYANYAIRSLYHHIKRLRTNLRPEQYNFTLANNVIAILVWGSYILYALYLLQVPKTGLSVVTAGLATGMGFAMKDLLENFFYGISLMTGRIRVGDYVECDGIQGRVESITYQSTQIIALDGSVIAFLNTQLFSKNFKNLTRNHHYEFVKIPIGVAYGANITEVRQMLIDAITPIIDIDLQDGRHLIKKDKTIAVLFSDFGASSVDLLVTYWILVDQKAVYASQVKETIYNTLNAQNIEIPFPQCDVHMRS